MNRLWAGYMLAAVHEPLPSDGSVPRPQAEQRSSSASWVKVGIVLALVLASTVAVARARGPSSGPGSDDSRPHARGLNGRGGDHWHAAIGFYICDRFAPDIRTDRDLLGIHTHGDGLVHIHPFTPLAAGKRATLQRFFEAVGAKVTSSEIELPGSSTSMRSGMTCGDRVAEVVVKVWDSRSPTDPGHIIPDAPASIPLRNNELITIAVVPKGTDIPRPPSEARLDHPVDGVRANRQK